MVSLVLPIIWLPNFACMFVYSEPSTGINFRVFKLQQLFITIKFHLQGLNHKYSYTVPKILKLAHWYSFNTLSSRQKFHAQYYGRATRNNIWSLLLDLARNRFSSSKRWLLVLTILHNTKHCMSHLVYKGNRMHLICTPGSSSHTFDGRIKWIP